MRARLVAVWLMLASALAVTLTPTAAQQAPPEWTDMLAAHNEKRRLHCVPPLAWDHNLQKSAQDFANKCIIGRHSNSGPGENLADFASWTIDAKRKETPTLPALTNRQAFERAWYCEVKQYNFNAPVWVGGFTQNCAPPTNGHFTQVVWKATKFMGCGHATCTINGHKGTHWVCQYSPGVTNANDPRVLRENVLRPTCR
jgi:hypothetical protein